MTIRPYPLTAQVASAGLGGVQRAYPFSGSNGTPVYVTDNTPEISEYLSNAQGQLGASPYAPQSAPIVPYRIAFHPNGKTVYVAGSDNSDFGFLNQYHRDPNTGALTLFSTTAIAGHPSQATSCAVTLDGKNLYLCCGPYPVFIQSYSIDATGLATALAQFPLITNTPLDIKFSHNGLWGYTACYSPGGNIVLVTRDPVTGLLSNETDYIVPHPSGIAISADDRFLFCSDSQNNTIHEFTIDPASGALGAFAQFAAGNLPGRILIHPYQNFLYCGNAGDSTISQYSFNPATGAAAPLSPATVATQSFPAALAITRNGQYMYVGNNGAQVTQYYANGPLVALSPSSFTVPGNVYDVAIF